MEIAFSQIYIEAGVAFPFSYRFQHYISRKVMAAVTPSATFREKYGRDFDLVFNVSAKTGTNDNEIRGPAVFKKTKDVEYTIFLPFDVISRKRDVPRSALQFLLKGTCSVLEALDIDTTRLKKQQDSIIDKICSTPNMFETDEIA
jgi:hypothetical protein